MAKALKSRPARKKKHAGKAVVPPRHRAPRKTKARAKPGATKRGAAKAIDQQLVPANTNESSTAIAATAPASSSVSPLLPFWPLSPFAVMRMWWGR
jgi:hypothetical protein